MAAFRLSFVSSIVSPWPLAPGTSGQIAQKPPLGAGSMMAVNSAFTCVLYVFGESSGSHRAGFEAGDPYLDFVGLGGVRGG